MSSTKIGRLWLLITRRKSSATGDQQPGNCPLTFPDLDLGSTPTTSAISVDQPSKSTSRNVAPSLKKRHFQQFRNVLYVAVLLMWATALTVVLVIQASICFFIPDAWRRKRDIGKDIVLVTNAGRGLGRHLAIVFGLRAALVVCWDPDEDRHMNTVYDIRHRGGRALGFTVDVTDETSVVNAAEMMKREVGLPGILVLSLGRRPQRPLLHWSPQDLEAIYRANVTPHLMLLRTFLPDMLARNYGHLVCIVSASASVPCSYDAPYAATKMGVAALMQGLADELDMHPGNQIRLTCAYPLHTDGRPSMADMAKVVVNQVLRGRRSVVVPKCSIFWMNLFRILPAPVRRRWRCVGSRLRHMEDSRTSFDKACPWADTCPRHKKMSSDSSYPEDFVTYAPQEMASRSSFDSVRHILKKHKKNDHQDEDYEKV